MLNWSQRPAVERIPGKVSGAWLFKGTRVPVTALFENLESGATVFPYPWRHDDVDAYASARDAVAAGRREDGGPSLSDDKRTISVAVKLRPNSSYVVWMNSDRFTNFKDEQGRSATPYRLSFTTSE